MLLQQAPPKTWLYYVAEAALRCKDINVKKLTTHAIAPDHLHASYLGTRATISCSKMV